MDRALETRALKRVKHDSNSNYETLIHQSLYIVRVTVQVHLGHIARLGQVHFVQVCLLLLLLVQIIVLHCISSTHCLIKHKAVLVFLHGNHVLKVLLIVHLYVRLALARLTTHGPIQFGSDCVEVALLFVFLTQLLGLVEAWDARLL